jgi:hypothetical protein
MTVGRGSLGLTMTIVGWLCVIGIVLLAVDMVETLPFMPEPWWRSTADVPLTAAQFDLRMMIICPGIVGWLGAWAYLGAFVWIPLAAWRVVRGGRVGISPTRGDRVLLALVPTLVVGVECLLRLTPLHYGYPIF